ncbi:peptide-methionine (S)-S-oxide reductase [Eudoraea sp.]|uniref:peptide-methionine (S)-S-oxide reductase n=2 Tax=Eudoraea sp. TaxID=1979955 RepID=UPI003C717CBF
MRIDKIGLGGGCHWCSEAVFQALRGVIKVEQGWISAGGAVDFHEAVILHFNPGIISLKELIEVHLYTHNSTSNHSMRTKYRSAVYTFNKLQQKDSANILRLLQKNFKEQLITRVFDFKKFRMSPESFQNYYQRNPQKPFCKTYIDPKLQMILRKFPKNAIEPWLIPLKIGEEQKIKK